MSVKRACDNCHYRKTKCDGINPCRRCSSANRSCSYFAIPKKKGPKSFKNNVMHQPRETKVLAKMVTQLNNIYIQLCGPTHAPIHGLRCGREPYLTIVTILEHLTKIEGLLQPNLTREGYDVALYPNETTAAHNNSGCDLASCNVASFQDISDVEYCNQYKVIGDGGTWKEVEQEKNDPTPNQSSESYSTMVSLPYSATDQVLGGYFT